MTIFFGVKNRDMNNNSTDKGRREFLTGTTALLGGIGASVAAIPFLATFQPSAKAKAIGAPVEADISQIEPGQRITVKWRGKPVWVVRRTEQQVEELNKFGTDTLQDPDSDASEQPEFAQNAWRSENSEFLVLVGICTHLGCSPNFFPGLDNKAMGSDWKGGFYCPCHGSKFDLAGRVYGGVPAPTNMTVPPYRFLSENRILIGELDGEAT